MSLSIVYVWETYLKLLWAARVLDAHVRKLVKMCKLKGILGAKF